MTAPLARIPVGIVVERRKAASQWIDFTWRPIEALAGTPEAAPWTPLGRDGEADRFYVGAKDIELFRSETSNYRDNLASASPALWVSLRPTGGEPAYDLLAVTADPAEGEAWTESGNDLVEPVLMPPEVRAIVEQFVIEHHVERQEFKRKRDRADPEALARRGRIREDGS